MNILLTGASGFIGRHLDVALTLAGFKVIRAVRSPMRAGDIQVDFTSDTHVQDWLPRLAGIDVVINAVGVLRDLPNTPMQAIHADAPMALFDAAAQSLAKQVIQVSALGADSQSEFMYMRTKGTADEHLQQLPIDWTIIRPSVVYGADGESATMFRRLADMPILFVPGQGEALLQPVHIDDICAAVVSIVKENVSHQIINAVGPEAMTYRDMIATYRAQKHTRAALVVPMPWPVMSMMTHVTKLIPKSPLDPETLGMLRAGSIANAERFESVLGHDLRHPNSFLREA